MKKMKFALNAVLISAVCLLPRLFRVKQAGEAVFSAVPAAGDISWLWLGIALIICAVGIIILVLSKRRK